VAGAGRSAGGDFGKSAPESTAAAREENCKTNSSPRSCSADGSADDESGARAVGSERCGAGLVTFAPAKTSEPQAATKRWVGLKGSREETAEQFR